MLCRQLTSAWLLPAEMQVAECWARRKAEDLRCSPLTTSTLSVTFWQRQPLYSRLQLLMVRPLRHDDDMVGWVCALPVELVAVQEILNQEHPDTATRPCTPSAQSAATTSRLCAGPLAGSAITQQRLWRCKCELRLSRPLRTNGWHRRRHAER
jgi:hypothetical protein